MTHPKLSTPQSSHGGRGYRIPGRVDQAGKQIVYPSVTTCLKVINKAGITQWAVDATAAYAVANISKLMERSEEVGFGFLRWHWNQTEPDPDDELRLRYKYVLNDAAEMGTNLHEFIEAELGDSPFPKIRDDRTKEMLEAWDEWLLIHDVVMHDSEFTVVNDDWGIAGTADGDWTITCLHDDPCLGTFEPQRCLVDLKTSRNTWPEHKMQIAALNAAPVRMIEVPEGTPDAQRHEATVDGKKVRDWWIEEPSPEFDRCILLHIRPNDLQNDGTPIPAFCKIIQVEDLDIYEEGFLGALSLVRMNRKIKQREAARRNGESND